MAKYIIKSPTLSKITKKHVWNEGKEKEVFKYMLSRGSLKRIMALFVLALSKSLGGKDRDK